MIVLGVYFPFRLWDAYFLLLHIGKSDGITVDRAGSRAVAWFVIARVIVSLHDWLERQSSQPEGISSAALLDGCAACWFKMNHLHPD